MEKDIKQLILAVSEQLFTLQGYSSTSMRQIAKACGISVGNLCYHFNKKEELLMAYHNKLYYPLDEPVPPELIGQKPWCSYIGAEYSFLHRCATNLQLRKLYLDVINVPYLRKEYTGIHNKLFLKFLPLEQLGVDANKAFLTSVIASSIEYHMMEQYDAMEAEVELDEVFFYVFEVRMQLLDVRPEKRSEYIKKGFALGKELSKQLGA